MFISKRSIPRRHILKGIGATLSLPLLDAMVPALTAAAQTAARPQLRAGFVYIPHGVIMKEWTPAAAGSAFEFTPILKPLEPFRDSVVVVSNLKRAGGQAEMHAAAASGWLSGAVPKRTEAEDLACGTSIDQMLARMDIVSVNCPHTPATYHLLSARRLKMLRPEAYIVNTSRGEVIDENALARLIEAGDIAGAGLDVFEHEPAVNPKLVKLARNGKVVLLPHTGSATIEGRIDMGEKVIINIRTFMDGHRPPDRVLPSML